MYQDMIGYARMYLDMLGCVRICKDALGYARMYQDIQGCVRMHTRIFQDMF